MNVAVTVPASPGRSSLRPVPARSYVQTRLDEAAPLEDPDELLGSGGAEPGFEDHGGLAFAAALPRQLVAADVGPAAVERPGG